MAHWDEKKPARENIRLFQAPISWRRYADDIDPDTRAVRAHGCARALDSFLLDGLNSTNVILLTGAGSSFCAKNARDSKFQGKTAPTWQHLWDAVEAKIGKDAFAAIINKLPNGKSITNIEKLLTQCKLYVALFGSGDGDGKTIAKFVDDAEPAILDCVDFVDGSTDLTSHEMLLLKVARRGVRKPRVKCFTTNYDLCFEYAAQRRRFVVIDGFSHASPEIYDRSHFSLDIVRRDGSKDTPDYLEGVLQLYKLHGSMDWRRVNSDVVRSRENIGKPVLIYPRDSKYQEAFDPPYLDMMSGFQIALREPDTTLFVAGFGFNDTHIAAPIIAALESNMSFRLVICDPAFLEDAAVDGDPVVVESGPENIKNDFHKKLLRLAQTGDQRVVLLHCRFEDLALALPDLVAETERERHAERIRSLRDLSTPVQAAR